MLGELQFFLSFSDITEVSLFSLGSPVKDTAPSEKLLDDNVLQVLGQHQEADNFSAPIQREIASQWDLLLKKGLSDLDRQQLLGKYKIPVNCTSAAPPKLNPEVKAAINEAALKRDERLEKVQLQMGVSLAALGKALSLLVSSSQSEEESRNLEIIEALSDGAKLLADIHHDQSVSRQNVVCVSLDKNLKKIIETTDIDGWLFGENLSEKMKNLKQIEKSGDFLKSRPIPMKKGKGDQKNYKIPLRQPQALGGTGNFRRRPSTYRSLHYRKEHPYSRKVPGKVQHRRY